MKKIFILFAAFVTLLTGLQAADLTGVKIYLNPGHGGYDGANDRNVETIPYALGDTLGFWESWSNLRKALALRNRLESAGATVYMSRTQNRDEDDRLLSEIAEEANANDVDAFLSIHSNALGSNAGTNYLLFLFHGYDADPTVPESKTQATAAWPFLFENNLTWWSNYTTTTNIRGDFSFYGNTSGLGVLRPLVVPGFLSEGSFHDYKPETHRLLNEAYRKLEADRFYKYFCNYFGADMPATGTIAGWVKGIDQRVNDTRYIYKAGTTDEWLPLNGAKVKLMNAAGDSLNSYTVDNNYNGVYAFFNLTPGTYKLRFSAFSHQIKDTTVTVTAANTTYARMMMYNPNLPLYKIVPPDYPNPVQAAGTIPMNHYSFQSLTQTNPDWLNGATVKKVLFRNEKLYVLTTEPKILIVSASTFQQIGEINLTGITGGTEILSDIQFTSNGHLLACNKVTLANPETGGNYFKVYSWETDGSIPLLYFQTQLQGNMPSAVVGETFAVTGAFWNSSVYASSVNSTDNSLKIVAYHVEDSMIVSSKYMTAPGLIGNTTADRLNFTISPDSTSYLIIDRASALPAEYSFDWNAADDSPVSLRKNFSEQNGYLLQPAATGNYYFRHARHLYMAAPNCNADATAVGVVLFDITAGLDQARKVSEFLPEGGLGTASSPCMAAAAKVTDYDIELIIVAEKEGAARFKTTSIPTPAVYASELKSTPIANGYRLTFTLNGNIQSGKITVLNGTTEIYTVPLGALSKGTQSVDLVTVDIPAGTYSWDVTVNGNAIDRPYKLSDNASALMQFNYPNGVAVDNNPASSYFGRIYVSESAGGALTARTTQDGVYILDAALTDITTQGATAYNGSVAWGATSSSSPMRLSVGDDGTVFVCDWSDAHPGVWMMNPASPTAAFKPVFEGLTKATSGLSSFNGVNIHGSISHCYSMGTGENRRLYTFDEDYINETATSPGNMLQYNIGTLAAPYQTAPLVVYNDAANGNLQQNGNSCIAPDSRGGWWISQYRATDAALIPSLIHVNTGGTVDYNSGLTPTFIENSYRAGMAVSYDGKLVAMGCNNEIKILGITYSGSGIPSLKLLYSIKPALGMNTTGLSFDRAGNVYAVSYTDKRLGVWSLPKIDNTFRTPAPLTQQIVVTSTGTNEIGKDSQSIRFFPNPVSASLTIQSANAPIETISIYELSGRLLIQTEGLGTEQHFKLNELSSGVYIIKIKTGKESFTGRIIRK
ncbi:MAG TPA: T9SS type A sorting domain-containing protein [Paludibacteraceae bacterium]|nr:T9SS type A sorting domain-containing protein [Paludibacteraceae bacterium]